MSKPESTRKTPGTAAAKAKSTRKRPRALSREASLETDETPTPRAKPLGKLPKSVAKLRDIVVDASEDLKGRELVVIDVREKSSFADLLVIVSGTSTRHVRSIADEMVVKAKACGNPPIGVEGEREGEWVLVDLGDIVAHVMLPRVREFYGLERLWQVGDADSAAAEAVDAYARA